MSDDAIYTPCPNDDSSDAYHDSSQASGTGVSFSSTAKSGLQLVCNYYGAALPNFQVWLHYRHSGR